MRKRMRPLGISLLFTSFVFWTAVCAPFASQHGSVSVDWKAELEKAQAGIERNPNSAFWHNQAGVAYDALGDFEHALKELKLASTLDPTNPLDDYAIFGLYQRRGMLGEQREALLNALEKDSLNPVSHFELADVLEKEGHLPDSLREYRTAKHLLVGVKGTEYIDPRGNPYEIDPVRNEVNQAIKRVAKLVDSKQHEK